MGFFGFPGFSSFLARRAAARKLAKTKKNKEIQRKTKKNKEIQRKTKNANDTGYFEKFKENPKISRKMRSSRKNEKFMKKHIFDEKLKNLKK